MGLQFLIRTQNSISSTEHILNFLLKTKKMGGGGGGPGDPSPGKKKRGGGGGGTV